MPTASKVSAPTFDVGLLPSKNNPDMPRAKVIADAKAAGQWLGPDGVLFTTEIGEREDLFDMRTGLGKGWTRTHLNESPIYLGADWQLAEGYVKPFSLTINEGNEGVTPHHELDVTYARFLGYPQVFGLFGVHMLSEAWCKHLVKEKAWRKRAWLAGWKIIQQRVKKTVDAGVPVILAGDLNAGADKPPGGLHLHPAAKHLVNGSLDHIFYVPAAGVHVTASNPISRNINSDHDFRRITLKVS